MLIVFDCDGTLVDSQQAVVRAVQDALAACGLPQASRTQILHGIGLPMDEAIRACAPDADAATRARVVTAWRDSARELEQQDHRGEVLFAGMRDVLASLAAETDTQLGIVTMKSRRGLERVLGHYDLIKFFQTTQTADDGPGKPSPVLLQQAMDECGARASATVMVGDTIYDMQMAQAAGVVALGVAWGYQEADELTESGAAAVLDTPLELLQFLRMRRAKS